MREANPFDLIDHAREPDPNAHVFGAGHRCKTDTRGLETPKGRSPFELRVNSSGGFIPLWAPEMMLRYRFQELSMRRFRDPEAARAGIRQLLGEALASWGDASPIRFAERQDAWDFEITVRNADDCDTSGCVLASSFFPDAGQHELVLYPEMFGQVKKEQVETLVHELGHVFGLRHFFANVSESAWPSELFGTDSQFSIMNYGANSYLTPDDVNDLKKLYQAAWAGTLTNINGTSIRLMKPFSSNRP